MYIENRLTYEAGKIGDELHPEPKFDDNGEPIIEEDSSLFIDENGKIKVV